MKLMNYILSKVSEIRNYKNKSIKIKEGAERNLYRTRFNDYYWLKESSYVDKCIISTGIFEENSTKVVQRFVKKGDTILDVGANIGYYSVLLSRLVGQSGKVYCFEPTSHYGKILKMNLEANKVRNVTVFNVGLSNKSQELEIQIGDSSATIHSPGKQSLLSKEIIKLVSLDEFIGQYNIGKIDFIKVDVDGHEPLFLEGAWETLDKYDPVILLEISHLHYLEAGYTAWDFYETLKKRNYMIYHEDKLVELKTREDFLIKCGNFDYSANIVISKRKLET